MARDPVEENEVPGSLSDENQNCQVATASSSLTSRATQTQEDRQTAAVQTTSNINPVDQNDVTKIVLEKSGIAQDTCRADGILLNSSLIQVEPW